MSPRRTPLSLAAIAGLLASASASAQLLVRLKYATFDPSAWVPAVPPSLAARPDARVWLVQFQTSPTESMRLEVSKRGGEILRFATDHTHIVRAGAIADLMDVSGVRWIGPYHPAYKLDAAILGTIIGAPEHGGQRYSIEAFDARGRERITLALARSGAILDFAPSTGQRLEATLTREQVLEAARMDDVNFIDPVGPAGADMDIVRLLVGAVPVLSNAGFTGQGVRGEVFDSGIDLNHPAFQNPPPLVHISAGSSPNHGSSVYGIIFGNDPNSPNTTGLLPNREQGIFCSYTVAAPFGGPNTNRDLIAQLVAPSGPFRAVFQSRAVGSPQVSAYTTISADIDGAAFEHDFLICQSMGDTGNINSRPEGWAKNVVSLGGLTHNNTILRADDLGGPDIAALDGRVKPDMIAPRDSISVAGAGGQYVTFGGVSAATGIAAGCFGLIHQMWHEGVWQGFGGGPSVFADRPHISTARALMFNAAYQYNWVGGGPNIRRGSQGWGVPDLAALYHMRGRTFIIDEKDALTPGQTATYTLYVLPGEPTLKATMVYLDPAGNPGAAQARINDLTLKVTSPSQTEYWGNHGLRDGIWSVPGGAEDTVNVVENVFIQNPLPGQWTIEVIGTEIVQDARLESAALDADFGLVVSGVSCYANCDHSSTPPVLTANDFSCFLNRFVAGDPYANCDGSTGAPILSANDFLCFIIRFAAPCP